MHLLHTTRREYQKMGNVLSVDLEQIGAGALARARSAALPNDTLCPSESDDHGSPTCAH